MWGLKDYDWLMIIEPNEDNLIGFNLILNLNWTWGEMSSKDIQHKKTIFHVYILGRHSKDFKLMDFLSIWLAILCLLTSGAQVFFFLFTRLSEGQYVWRWRNGTERLGHQWEYVKMFPLHTSEKESSVPFEVVKCTHGGECRHQTDTSC